MDTVRALLLFFLLIFVAAFQLFAIFSSNVSIFTSIFSNQILKRNNIPDRKQASEKGAKSDPHDEAAPQKI